MDRAAYRCERYVVSTILKYHFYPFGLLLLVAKYVYAEAILKELLEGFAHVVEVLMVDRLNLRGEIYGGVWISKRLRSKMHPLEGYGLAKELVGLDEFFPHRLYVGK
ncbi:hypothetical protein EVA_15330 [gut metagenome]|uniref:Uncharacterized protein n=1 Tax=gut metagenome TaxID=749906 RepID=J9FQ27_9ZZZZ